MKLNVKALGCAFGLMWALGVLFLGLLATYFNYGNHMVQVVASLYYGYDATLIGSLIGTAWGFVDGLICGVLLAFFYNLLQK